MRGMGSLFEITHYYYRLQRSILTGTVGLNANP